MYSIQAANQASHEEILALVCTEFLAGSVLHRALTVSESEYASYMADPIRSLVAQECSFVAFDKSTRVMVACILAGDFQPPAPQLQLPSVALPAFAEPINALLSSLEQQYVRCRTSESLQSTLLVDIAVVAPLWRGQGLYAQLRDAVHQCAHKRGYSRVVGELSSAATQHLCIEKLGHKVICEIAYKSFQFGGSYPFASIDNPSSIQLVEGLLE